MVLPRSCHQETVDFTCSCQWSQLILYAWEYCTRHRNPWTHSLKPMKWSDITGISVFFMRIFATRPMDSWTPWILLSWTLSTGSHARLGVKTPQSNFSSSSEPHPYHLFTDSAPFSFLFSHIRRRRASIFTVPCMQFRAYLNNNVGVGNVPSRKEGMMTSDTSP